MSDDASEIGHLEPSEVLVAAIDRLRADRHNDLADAVERVKEYLRDLAAAHTEIAMATDRVLHRGAALLSTGPAPVTAASSPASDPRDG